MPPLQNYLTSPIFPDAPEKTLRVANLYLVLKVYLLAHLLGLPLFLFRWGTLGGLAVFSFSFSFMGAMLLLARRGLTYLVGWAMITELWLLLMANAAFTGGARSVSYTAGGFLAILATAFLLNWREALAVTGVTIGYGIVLAVLQEDDRLPAIANQATSPYIYLAAQAIYLLAAMGLLFVATKSIRTLIQHQQAELAERTKAEAEARLSEQRYRMLAENIPNSAIVLFDHDLRFILVDGPELANTGYSKTMMEGKTLYEALPPEFAALAAPNMQRTLAGEQFTAELPFGDLYHFYQYVPLRDATGAISFGLILIQDITDRKRLEQVLQLYTVELENMVEHRTADLRTAKEQIEVVIENARDAMALVRPNGDVQLANPAFRSMFDPRASIEIESILSSLPVEADIEAVARGLVAAMLDRRASALVTQVRVGDGTTHDVDVGFVPVSGEEDQHLGMVLSAHDITQHKELERLKAQFIANAVHDLGTPITALVFRVSLLKSNPQQFDKHIQSLERQVEHLGHLLEDMRMLSQLDRGMLQLDMAPSDLNDVIQRVFDTYEPVAMSRSQTLTLDLDPTLPSVPMDPRQMGRVILNLLSNAINYTHPHKSISIRTFWDDTHVYCSVHDEGIGMSESELALIFDRFFRTDQARLERSTGTGLGLPIVKEIMDLHGGTVSVKSAVGIGSTFTISLPV
ncbi:MAG: hypothetical protein BroJett018_51190 [Chloroflexota bacterium]|nr:MAG: hypothetical protein BroJett018_51190 [Chloroflexota bacterium]